MSKDVRKGKAPERLPGKMPPWPATNLHMTIEFLSYSYVYPSHIDLGPPLDLIPLGKYENV